MKILRLSSFTIVSGVGWCMDFAIFNSLIAADISYLVSNLISASFAVTFVFLTSRKWIFRNHHGSLHLAAGEYVLWNAVAISAVSYLLKVVAALLTSLDLQPVLQIITTGTGQNIDRDLLVPNLAKILVTPFSMYANFVAIGIIIERRLRFF
jgi:putative flippase GtrA